MSIVREVSRSIRMTAVLWVLTAVIYPAVMLLVGLVFPYQAQGSLIKNVQGQVVGSALIGQSFTSDKYFWSRPSSIEYSSLTPDEQKQMKADLELDKKQNKTKEEQDKLTAAQNNQSNITYGTSGASNLAPSSTKELFQKDDSVKLDDQHDLLKRIKGDIDKLQKAGVKPTADLVYTSGSGLDPHISVEAANAQVDKVARVRSLPPDQVKSLIAKNTDGRFLGIFGEPGVNVLKLNLALDALKPT